MKKYILSVVAILMAIAVFAQDTNTFLWKVSGNGLKKDSYVLGTLHMACGPDFRIDDKIKEAIKGTDRIALELNANNPETVKALQANIGPVPGFFDGLAPEKKKLIDSVLTAKNLNPAMLDQVGPAVLVSLLSMQAFECQDPAAMKSMELELLKLEGAEGKPVDELETAEYQINLMNEFFKAEDLYTYLRDMDIMKAETKKLVAAYFNNQPKELEDLMAKTSTMSPEKEELMLTKRNKEWLNKMPEMMNNNSVFFAVGAAHLLGKNGVIQLLKDKGYTVTPVI
ncbi:TraB/GumN family protein [Sphingobacterium sp. 1.A.5]|jgi:uncharacterized protein YbaP (TraB family)|uniref:TraB/GumN family protein n=1 Tax=Sphingobacterium sp. 1.A.5 TaxID=2044604 RepID=UPI000C0C05AF|nr:TraB/GumN family protein [Sphingobacterium sp. 1.A.5]